MKAAKGKSRKYLLVVIFSLLVFGVGFGGLAMFRPSQNKLVSPEPSLPDDFSLVVLPDTQVYSRDFPEIFSKQAQWIVDHREENKIVFVSHLGDITDSWDDESEWKNADQALGLLDPVVAYGLLPGNHDDPQAFNQFFPAGRFEKKSWYGGHYNQDYSNNYQLISVGSLDFLILHLENEPGGKVLKWADQVLKKYQSRRAIVATHYFLDYDGIRSPVGQRIFKALSDNDNLFLILSGHIYTEVKRTDLVNNRPIHQLLADYQIRPNGGNGWLRILKFVPGENKIYVSTYSPWLDQYETDENSQFVLKYQMTRKIDVKRKLMP
ncbi:metallophosphoesterase [Patescibacteria group bacterium]